MSKPSLTIDQYASIYVKKFGWHLVPIKEKSKIPIASDWGNNCLVDPDEAANYYSRNPNHNIGLALGPSKMVSLDLDCEKSFRVIMDEFGLPYEAVDDYPTILGKGKRVMFRAPDGVNLPYCRLTWPNRNDPDKSKHRAAMKAANDAREAGDTDREERIRRVAKRWNSYTVFELRSATDGVQRFDCAPPSVHPDTGKAYSWLVQPPKSGEFPEPPPWLMAIWEAWKDFAPQFRDSCPWIPEPPPKPEPQARQSPQYDNGGTDIIGEYNLAKDITGELERYGYKRVGRRYLSPHSGTGLPGVNIMTDSNKCYIFHASDPLCSIESGQPVGPFDLFCYYDHNGDASKAVKAAAKELGIKSDRRPPRVAPTTPTEPAPDYTGGDEVAIAEQAFKAEGLPATTRRDTPGCDLDEPLPWMKSDSKPYAHHSNLAEISRRLGVTIRYNVISKEEEIVIPGAGFSVDNQANASLAWLQSQCSLFNFPVDRMGGMITLLADANPYNPVISWITSREWDGKPRMQSLFNTVIAKGEHESKSVRDLKETLIKRWMMSAIAGAFNPRGVSAGGVLVFQGAQYLGKTMWFKKLVPEDIGILKDGMLLKPDDKDSVKQVCSYWLVELGELDGTFSKSDASHLKAFITRGDDTFRKPYAARESKFARRTVFFGSVNPREYLNDPTGNRRYWTIECEHLDLEHTIDMQQCWAEAYEMFKGGEDWFLTDDEMKALNSSNEEFLGAVPVEEMIKSALDWDSDPDTWEWKQVTNTLLSCGIDRPTRSDATIAGTLIGNLNGGKRMKDRGKTLLLTPKKKFNCTN